ncbi:MAG: hypothetical protein IIV79_03545 [Clostridia bacterium]|nr:hypothetical protein [Clostridia bacterium]MBQ5743250.1 hypothetical protein [Clostridia bacterium]
MQAITRTEFEMTHTSQDIDKKDFQRLSQSALDLTELLCFGRADLNETAARNAMKEMIDYWISRGGVAALSDKASPKSERVGNYSVTHREGVSLNGIPISPAALLILDNAGLRNRNV